jgi:hypothetical protein
MWTRFQPGWCAAVVMLCVLLVLEAVSPDEGWAEGPKAVKFSKRCLKVTFSRKSP